MKKLIFHIPHASTHIPSDVRLDILISDTALAEELRLLTDHFTELLFGNLAGPGDRIVACPVSRLVVDVERFADDAIEPMSAQGMGAVYTHGCEGTILRRSLESRGSLLKRFYDPHHTALHDAVETHLSEQGQAVIIDCHSFPERALPYERNQTLHRPEICVGTDAVHTPETLAASIMQAYMDAGFEIARNTPFAGAIVPFAHYEKNRRVQSLMIEIRRDLYMDEATSRLNPDLVNLIRANKQAVRAARDLKN